MVIINKSGCFLSIIIIDVAESMYKKRNHRLQWVYYGYRSVLCQTTPL